jgi:alpha-tubulin suppressor-like RCC1 family protein
LKTTNTSLKAFLLPLALAVPFISCGNAQSFNHAPGTVVAWGDEVIPYVQVGTRYQAIAAGDLHSLALKSDGTVVAWGDNFDGQSVAPPGVSDVVAIAAGGVHSLALKSDGTVVAWGDVYDVEINTVPATVPMGLNGVVAIAAGYDHDMALKSDGTVVGWGVIYNSTASDYILNTVPAGLNDVVAIAAGQSHSLALKSDSTVVAWGDNYYGESRVPAGLNGVVAIAAGGNHSLALRSNGTVVAWGVIWNGTNYVPEVLPTGLSGVVAIAVGSDFSVAVVAGGTVVAWGASYSGHITVPMGLSGVVSIAAGSGHSLALKSDGTVVAFGNNVSAQCMVPGALSDVCSVAGGGDYNSLALKSDGTVVAWGYNNYGQSTVPMGLSGVVGVAAGGYHSLALKSNGTIVAWGDNSYGQTTVPANLNGVVAIAAGEDEAQHGYSLALKSDGTIVGWGDNSLGEIAVPANLTGVVAIAAGDDHGLALKSDGTVVAWGDNSYGQRTVPANLTGVIAIAAGSTHSLALKSDGTVVAWGEVYGISGRFGSATVPTGLSGVVAIAAGGVRSLALKSDGTIVAWGVIFEEGGQIISEIVPAGLNGATAIAAAGNWSLAIVATPAQIQAPSIFGQPANQTAQAGSAVTLTVYASGNPSVTYQWQFNGQNIAYATSATLTLNSVTAANSGGYSVIVSNAFGVVRSAVAQLYVYIPPSTSQPQTPAATPTTLQAPPGMCAAPRTPTSAQMVVFPSGALVDPTKMTIVLTHGWQDAANNSWPSDMAKALISQGFGATANIVAWDWHDDAGLSFNESVYRTLSQGYALGDALLNTLGSGYNLQIHFLGHSLGTVVNCHAADCMHGDVDPSITLRPPWTFHLYNSQMTLFDEAEVPAAIGVSVDVLYPGVTLSGIASDQWTKVIPDQRAWVDNYVSEVGLLHPEAANVLLWRHFGVPLIYDIPAVENFLDVTGLHGYSWMWYSNTVVSPIANAMGNGLSFERKTLGNAPCPPAYFIQSLNVNASPLVVTSIDAATAHLVSSDRMIVYPTLQAYQAVGNIVNASAAAYQDGIQYVGSFVANMEQFFVAPPTGQAVFSGIADSTPAYYLPPAASQPAQADWSLHFTLQNGLSSQLEKSLGTGTIHPNDGGASAANSVYVLVPVKVPTNAIGLSFQFQLSGAGTNEYITMGVSNQNYFTLESQYVQDGAWTETTMMDVSAYAGQQV